MCDTCFLKCFQAPNIIINYDGKTNPSVWLKDYRLACKAGGADDDIFIIQFLPHLPGRHGQGQARPLAQELN
jgi:hypothetical protein